MPQLDHFRLLFRRDLQALRAQVAHYPNDDALWQDMPGWLNPSGTLVLHLCGNLRTYIGAQLGGTGYRRDRPAEFADRGLTRQALQSLIDTTAAEVEDALARMDAARLKERAPVATPEQPFPTDLWLMHLSTHLTYHLGQIDYHRRAVTGDTNSAGSLSMKALSDAGLGG